MFNMILAGGKGKRLWPLSTDKEPKQFLKIFNELSLFQKTLKRSLNFLNPEEIYVVTNENYRQYA